MSEGLGFATAAIAVLGFGSNFVPVKRFETGDGMFYQWVMCSAIFIYGVLLQLLLFLHPYESDALPPSCANATTLMLTARPDAHSVKLYPFAILGGALWATGNTMAVPVINLIGLSLGLLIWGCTNMLVGWATGRFGLFGLEQEALADEGLNYAGVCFVLVALALYTLIRADAKAEVDDGLLLQVGEVGSSKPADAAMKKSLKRAAGILLAMLSGAFYGSNFTPNTYMMEQKLGPAKPLDYVFSHFTGIYLTSTFWFVVYCVGMRSAPRIFPRLVLPSMLSGLVWAIAQTCWFISNDALSLSVAFPIITSGPGAVGAAWGVFVFGEIKGRRNFCVLGAALSLTIAGCVLIGLSKN
mmetsp:Transcript_10639/g.22616  ORF Transcript_10639/g.22616 Transcript_10639/m.22616 type:complete len:355 (+) Transcript_10639:241-1305(+)